MSIINKSLKELLPETLTYSLCIHIEKGKEVWVVAGMLAQYLESATDSVLVLDEEKPVGVVGGKEILENILKTPTSSLFFDNKVEDIMESDPFIVSDETKYGDLMTEWKKRGRAYAILKNEWNNYSAISAKKILEIGMRCKTNLSVSDLPKKSPITFKKDDTMESIIKSMFENKTRKILLENSNKYINDRIIIETITEKMAYLKDIDYFLNVPANIIDLEEARVIHDDLKINEVSAMLYDMEHPYIIYKDSVVTPWDICNILLNERIDY
ncbi:MAG: CBS domain-containing protein [Nitrosopumilaceae archaeon]|nr:CBS domain-containing protein [Nitrosopumilaceae archaeon]NIP10266.1 CBS domain-containing protein [Nitrosopumilaceae archaeon]NIS94409.1 CBS domain-containing protein [Nitrosopumilaceae archaeon]